MPLIPGRFLAVLEEPLRERGLPLERWLEGLPVRAEQITDGAQPLEWDDLVELVDRAATHLGGPERLEELMFEVRPTALGGLASVFELTRTPERLCEVVTRYLNEQLSPPLHARHERGRFRPLSIVVTIDEGVRSSPAFWHALCGVLRGALPDVGLPAAQVTASLGERRARFEIRGERRPLLSRVWIGAFGASRHLISEFQNQQRELQRSFNDVQRQADALRASEARNRALVEQLEHQVTQRTRELERRNEQLRALQERLIQSERLGATQELAGSVAHAINNPLAALIGRVQMMLEASTPPDPELEQVHQVAQRIRDVVTRTLQLFRQGELDLSSEDPLRVLEDVRASLEPLAADKVRLEIKGKAGLPSIEIDAALFRAALGSLAENAVEATRPGGTVWLELDSVPSMNVIEFRIVDSGTGIPPALRDKAFEPFFTTKSGGTGLGLSIAQGVIAGHRGRLTLRSRPGGGTIASVELPLATDADGVSARAS